MLENNEDSGIKEARRIWCSKRQVEKGYRERMLSIVEEALLVCEMKSDN